MKQTTTISISKAALRQGRELAKTAKRSFSAHIEHLIEQAVAQAKAKKEELAEASK